MPPTLKKDSRLIVLDNFKRYLFSNIEYSTPLNVKKEVSKVGQILN
jgi:hypothetical protein